MAESPEDAPRLRAAGGRGYACDEDSDLAPVTDLAQRRMRDDIRDGLKQVLTEQGMDVGGASPHSWRCEHPDRYPGYCTCVDDLITAIIERFDLAPKIEEGVIPWEAYARASGWEPPKEGITVHMTHRLEGWNDHIECLNCGLNTSVGDEWARLALRCERA